MSSYRQAFALVGLFLAGLVAGGLAIHLWEAREPAPTPVERLPVHSWHATLFLPTADNQGKPFPDAEWDRALGVLVQRFGGATLGAPQQGCWVDDQKQIHREPIRPVIITLDKGKLDEYRQAIQQVGKLLGQQVMYYHLEERRVEQIAVK